MFTFAAAKNFERKLLARRGWICSLLSSLDQELLAALGWFPVMALAVELVLLLLQSGRGMFEENGIMVSTSTKVWDSLSKKAEGIGVWESDSGELAGVGPLVLEYISALRGGSLDDLIKTDAEGLCPLVHEICHYINVVFEAADWRNLEEDEWRTCCNYWDSDQG
nr:hypothetical protein Iba_chr07fCG9760 [Ipomoea batatas]